MQPNKSAPRTDELGLNADTGWAAALDAPATVFADRPFRLRFEVRCAPAAAGPAFCRLHCRRNAGAWTPVEAHDFPHPESKDARSPRVSLVACAAYPPGAPTADLLAGSAAPFQAGSALGLAAPGPAPAHTVNSNSRSSRGLAPS